MTYQFGSLKLTVVPDMEPRDGATRWHVALGNDMFRPEFRNGLRRNSIRNALISARLNGADAFDIHCASMALLKRGEP